MQEELEVAKRLAVRAGALLLAHYARPPVGWKGPGNPVTDADRSASAFLVQELERLCPKDGIVCEEEPDDPERLSKSRIWMIDPMDGTTGFVKQCDEFAVMIGLAVNGKASLGVVYQPTTQKMYYGVSGSGAFVVDKRTTRLLRVSRNSNPDRMTIAVSRLHHSPEVDGIRERLRIPGVIVSGSIGLKVGLICEGRADIYVHPGSQTRQWDTCAPEAILIEAGGCMTDLSNTSMRYNTGELRNLRGVIATNGAIHDRIVETAQSVRQELRDARAR
jgi:3'(2'), 5'-bisphosphate nucleotidase